MMVEPPPPLPLASGARKCLVIQSRYIFSSNSALVRCSGVISAPRFLHSFSAGRGGSGTAKAGNREREGTYQQNLVWGPTISFVPNLAMWS